MCIVWFYYYLLSPTNLHPEKGDGENFTLSQQLNWSTAQKVI